MSFHISDDRKYVCGSSDGRGKAVFSQRSVLPAEMARTEFGVPEMSEVAGGCLVPKEQLGTVLIMPPVTMAAGLSVLVFCISCKIILRMLSHSVN